MLKLYTSENKVFLEILKTKLEATSIEARINNYFPPAAGEITTAVAWPELWIINDEQIDEAKKILAFELENQKTIHPDWDCPECGEHLEGQFNECWKCGHMLERS